jgi:ATP-binding cassette subfamily B protein
MRFSDPGGGVVRVGGVSLRDCTRDEVRRRITIVTQDVQLFAASVRDNLTFFDPAVPDRRLTAALDAVGLGAWLRALPDGLETPLEAGGRGLSAGEAQLFAFARVLLRDPGLVILDEASSRLDPTTEGRIRAATDVLLRRRTGIVIAHRLATVQRVDDVLILEGGRILERGPRAALAADPASRFSALVRAGLEPIRP